jgi:hypothetical protein
MKLACLSPSLSCDKYLKNKGLVSKVFPLICQPTKTLNGIAHADFSAEVIAEHHIKS